MSIVRTQLLGSPLNVADQGAYKNTFLHVPQLNWEPVQGEKGATDGNAEGPIANAEAARLAEQAERLRLMIRVLRRVKK